MPMQGYPQQIPPQYVQGNPGYPTQQPPVQAGRGYASNDRLPAIPEMLRRPDATTPPVENRQPIVRGAAPEQNTPMREPVPASSPEWTPIQIPTPAELGIPTSQARPMSASLIAPPQRYDLATVTDWLDRQGTRSWTREKLPEGLQMVCHMSVNEPAITVRGTSEEETLQKLVQEVIKRKQELTQNQR